MGLTDILTGMMNGPRGDHSAPHDEPHSEGGGISKIDWALIALLAYRTFQGKGPLGGIFGGGHQAAPGDPAAVPPPGGGSTTAAPGGGGFGGGLGGGLGGILKSALPGGGGGLGGGLLGGLGGLLAGGAAGSLVNGGLGDILKQFQQHGLGDAANSWVGTGENKPISADDIRKTFGDDTVRTLAEKAGLPPDELASGLAQRLPDFVHKLTPHGRVPEEHEV